MTQPHPVPPVPTVEVEALRTHADERIEKYGWLADQDDPRVLAHLQAENAYTEAVTADLQPLRERIFEEIVARTTLDDVSVPARLGAWWYYSRTAEGAQYPVYLRCPAAESWEPPQVPADAPIEGETVLLDGNAEAAGLDFFALGAVAVSPDAGLLLYSVDEVGDERFTLRVKDLRTGELLADQVAGAFYGAVWAATSDAFYYLVSDDTWRPYEVRCHRLGQPVEDDTVLFTETDERFWVDLDLSSSRQFLIIGSNSKLTSEYHLLDLQDPVAELSVVTPRQEGLEYDVDHAEIGGWDRLVIVHNGVVDENGRRATDFAVAMADVTRPQEWRTVLADRPGVRVSGAVGLPFGVVVTVRREACSRIVLLPALADGTLGEPWELAFDEELYTADLGTMLDPAAPFLRIDYVSYTCPATVYELALPAEPGAALLLRKQTVVQGVDLSRYRARREWATAPDGVAIPISVVHLADAEPTGNPLLLYGYGSYESSMEPNFTVSRLSLLERGVVFAVAHVRGGGELGRDWYEQARLDRKMTTFTDFLACADELLAAGWADPARLVAFGGSAGGLLIGAVLNQRPEAFAGVLAAVPFVDPLTTMLDPSLPLTVVEREEWGDPIADPAIYHYIKSYSPYEQVSDRPYPPVLATTSVHDTRVRYVEPAKWIARLRELAPSGGPYLLRTELAGGHGGGSGRYQLWRDRAFEYAWLLDKLGCSTT